MLKNWALWASIISMFMLGLGDNVRGPIYPDLLQAYGVSNFIGAFFFTTASFFGFLGSYVGHFFVKGFGLSRLLALSLLGYGFAFASISLGTQFYQLILSCTVIGFSLGLMALAQNLTVIAEVKKSQLPQATNALHSIYGLASLIAPLIVGALMQAGAGWKSPLLVVGGLAMLAGLLFLVVDLMGAYKASGVAAPPPEPNSPPLEKFDWKPYYVALALGFYVVCEIMVGTRLSQYAQSVLGSSPETGAIITTCFFVGLFSGRVVYIFLKPKISALQQLKLSLLGSFSTLSLGFTMQSWPLVALSALLMAPFYPLSIAFAQELFSKNLNRAMSVVLGISSFCIIVMHLGVGVLTDQFGLQAALWVGPILLCASFLMLMWLPKVFSKVEVR